MNRLKDIIYDKNDILIALIIVIIAGMVIYGRINVIMEYPATLAAEAAANAALAEDPDDDPVYTGDLENPDDAAENPDTEEPADDPGNVSNEGGGSDEEGGSGEEQPPAGNENQVEPTAPSLITITIESGALGSRIAQILIDAGLIDSSSEFYNAVEAAGADTKLQAGTFRIPSNATPAEIVDIITK